MFLKILILCCILSFIQVTFGRSFRHLDHDIGEVVYVNILYRHGDRTPIDPYPNDPYKNLSYWPCDWGQLTNLGKQQHYIFGNWLRTRYGHLIPGGHYNNRAIYVRSTDVDRALMSAESNLAGMFPPVMKDRWGTIKWQPIPVHTAPETYDKLLAMKVPCKRYDVAYKHAMNSPEMIAIHDKYKDLFDYLTLHSGRTVNNLDGVDYILSTLDIEVLANLTLPKWTEKVFPEPMKEAGGLSFAVPTFTKELKRLRGGPLVKEMLDLMTQKVEGTLERNISVYSGHDTTIANTLNAMGIFNNIAPPFTSSVMVELRKNHKDNNHYVTVLYKNTTYNSVPHVLTIPGCTEACPLEKMKSLLYEVTPTDWDSECHSHDLFDISNGQPYHSLAIFAMVTSTLVVFLVLASASVYWNKQKPTHLYKKLKIETL